MRSLVAYPLYEGVSDEVFGTPSDGWRERPASWYRLYLRAENDRRRYTAGGPVVLAGVGHGAEYAQVRAVLPGDVQTELQVHNDSARPFGGDANE